MPVPSYHEIHAWAGDDPGPNHATDKRYTVNESFDGGMGMFQLTNARPTAEQSWNWQSNCTEGLSRLETCMQGGATKLASLIVEANETWREVGPAPTIPPETINGITFTDTGANSFAVAMGLKRYNGRNCGYGTCGNTGCDRNGDGCTGEYLQWVVTPNTPESPGHWASCRVANAGGYCNRYVRDVCNVASQD